MTTEETEVRLAAFEQKLTDQATSHAHEISQMQKTHADQIGELQKTIVTLSAKGQPPKVEKRKPLEVPKETFKVGGKEYQFQVARFRYQKNVITSEEALKQPKVLEDLVKIKSGLIKQIF